MNPQRKLWNAYPSMTWPCFMMLIQNEAFLFGNCFSCVFHIWKMKILLVEFFASWQNEIKYGWISLISIEIKKLTFLEILSVYCNAYGVKIKK